MRRWFLRQTDLHGHDRCLQFLVGYFSIFSTVNQGFVRFSLVIASGWDATCNSASPLFELNTNKLPDHERRNFFSGSIMSSMDQGGFSLPSGKVAVRALGQRS